MADALNNDVQDINQNLDTPAQPIEAGVTPAAANYQESVTAIKAMETTSEEVTVGKAGCPNSQELLRQLTGGNGTKDPLDRLTDQSKEITKIPPEVLDQIRKGKLSPTDQMNVQMEQMMKWERERQEKVAKELAELVDKNGNITDPEKAAKILKEVAQNPMLASGFEKALEKHLPKDIQAAFEWKGLGEATLVLVNMKNKQVSDSVEVNRNPFQNIHIPPYRNPGPPFRDPVEGGPPIRPIDWNEINRRTKQ